MKKFKILAVDDDVSMRMLYTELLSEAGYQVETAAETTAAVILFRESPADLVILDVDMPSGGGHQAYDIIHNIISEGLPIIFVTGLPERVDPSVSTRSNVRVFKKPVDNAVLVATIARLLTDGKRQVL
jgi:DNA-binding response OmpR family regulator